MVEETHKIMHAPEIAISATCVRVPVKIGTARLFMEILPPPHVSGRGASILSKAPVWQLWTTSKRAYPYPEMAAGQDAVYVGGSGRRFTSQRPGLVGSERQHTERRCLTLSKSLRSWWGNKRPCGASENRAEARLLAA